VTLSVALPALPMLIVTGLRMYLRARASSAPDPRPHTLLHGAGRITQQYAH